MAAEAAIRGAIEGLAMDDAKQVIERLVGLRGAAYQLAARLLAGRDGAEDVVQQAYLAAIRSLRSSPPPEDERAWFLLAGAHGQVAGQPAGSPTAKKRRTAARSGVVIEEPSSSSGHTRRSP